MKLRPLRPVARTSVLHPERPAAVKDEEGRRFVCVLRADRSTVDALEDRCPHEGHPLSMGTVRGKVLTCQWHNWKFDLTTGECLHGGESVTRFDAQVVHDELFVDATRDAEQQAKQHQQSIVRNLARGDVDAVAREALRLASVTNANARAAETILRTVCSTAPYGIGDTLAMLAATQTLRDLDVLSSAEMWLLVATAAVHETRTHTAVPRWTSSPHTDDAQRLFLEDMFEERRLQACARVASALEVLDANTLLRTWLLPYVSLKLWDRDAAMGWIWAASRMLTTLSQDVQNAVLLSLTYRLSWCTAESDLPPWRHTRQCLLDLRQREPMPADASRDLQGNEREMLRAVRARLHTESNAQWIVGELTRLAVERVGAYDLEASKRLEARVTGLEVARCISYCVAAASMTSETFAPAYAVLAAGWVGKLHRYVIERDDTHEHFDWKETLRWSCLEARHHARELLQAVVLSASLARWAGDDASKRQLATRALHRVLREDRAESLARRAHHAAIAVNLQHAPEEDL